MYTGTSCPLGCGIDWVGYFLSMGTPAGRGSSGTGRGGLAVVRWNGGAAAAAALGGSMSLCWGGSMGMEVGAG